MKHQQFLLHLGHVEEQSLAQLPLSHCEGFDSPLEAMRELKKLLMVFNVKKVLSCCEENAALAEENAFHCKRCGRRLPSKEDSEAELEGMAAETFRSMFGMTNDSIAASRLMDLLEAHGWQTNLPDPSAGVTTIVSVDRWMDEGEGAYMGWFSPDGEGSTFG